MAEINVKINDELIEDLSEVCLKNNLNLEELVLNYVQQGLDNDKGVDNMSMISLDRDVMEKVNIVVRLTDQTPEEVVNDALRDQLRTVEDVPEMLIMKKFGMLLTMINLKAMIFWIILFVLVNRV